MLDAMSLPEATVKSPWAAEFKGGLGRLPRHKSRWRFVRNPARTHALEHVTSDAGFYTRLAEDELNGLFKIAQIIFLQSGPCHLPGIVLRQMERAFLRRQLRIPNMMGRRNICRGVSGALS